MPRTDDCSSGLHDYCVPCDCECHSQQNCYTCYHAGPERDDGVQPYHFCKRWNRCFPSIVNNKPFGCLGWKDGEMVPVQAKQGQPLKVYATELKEVFKGRHWAGPYISAASFEDTELMMCDSPYKVLGELGDTSGVVKTDFVAPPPIKQHG